MKILNIYLNYFKINIKRLFEYKCDFVFNLISVIIWCSANLFNIWVLFSKLNYINGWTFAQIGLLYGMWSTNFAIYCTFGNGILEIENLVVTGNLDCMLTKPLNPLLQIICLRINTMGIGMLIVGIATISISSTYANINGI